MSLAPRLAPLVGFGLLACNGGVRDEPSLSSFGDDAGTHGDGEITGSTSAGSTSAGSTSAATETSTSSTGDGDDSGNDDEPTFDLPMPDAGVPPGPQLPPTCDTIDDYPRTSVGCEFFAVDLPVYSGNSYDALGVSVGNPSADTAVVVIEDLRGEGNTARQLIEFELAPQDSRFVRINGEGGLLDEQQHDVHEGFNETAAFRIRSDVPVTAMQINPAGGALSDVPEASMLLPINGLDTAYYSVGYTSWIGDADPEPGDGWTVVVAVEDATTVATLQGNLMLDAFDAYLFDNEQDATGFFVGADRPVAVFSGTSCTNVPSGNPYCDHLEEQVIPLAAWGTEYIGARHPPRLPDRNPAPESVFWRVITAAPLTTFEISPPLLGLGSQFFVGEVGSFYEFQTPNDFRITADKPFMLVQYMTGCASVSDSDDACQGIDTGVPGGDPFMAQTVPVEQWLTVAPFVTDTSYPRDFVVVARELGTEVTLECLGVLEDERFVAIPNSGYEVGFVDLDIADGGGEGNCVDGAQYITADSPIGILVGGVDAAASYGYPGGMGLRPLWVPPQTPPG